jgi:4-diphosphocytidyl-2-C-methyl-D-erythritol kinase
VQIRRSATGIEVLAPAKINLFFEVLSRRDDGLHEIETLMLPIGLFDTLLLEGDPTGQVSLDARWTMGCRQWPSPDPSHASSTDNEFGNLPEVENNIAVRAVRLLAQRAGISRGAKLRLIKRIPAAAGLGGGSSDAAAALAAANLAWNLCWPTEKLMALAAELGSDVPFFFADGPAVCRGRGEKIQPVGKIGKLYFVVIKPPAGLSTAVVYRACRPGDPRQWVDPVVQAVRKGKLGTLGPMAHNRLLEPARRLSPWIDKTLNLLTQENCPVVGMSGSGSACFALCHTAGHALRVAARLRNKKYTVGWVWPVQTV